MNDSPSFWRMIERDLAHKQSRIGGAAILVRWIRQRLGATSPLDDLPTLLTALDEERFEQVVDELEAAPNVGAIEGLLAQLRSVWADVDPLILERKIIQGIIALREQLGASIPGALDAYVEHYDHLRKHRSADFNCDHETYWEGFYS